MANIYSYSSKVYFDELDALGVLHHTRYLLHLERAQQAFFEHLLDVPDFDAERDEDIYVVVRSIESRFRAPVRSPGEIRVHCSVDRIRSGGVTMGFKITSPDRSIVYCDGSRTVCKLSGQTHRPTPWTENFRAKLDAFAAG